jgi:hypothetical protein
LGESESLLGDFIKPVRDDLVIATKYTQSADPKGSLSVTGDSRKAMIRSLEQSLNRLISCQPSHAAHRRGGFLSTKIVMPHSGLSEALW